MPSPTWFVVEIASGRVVSHLVAATRPWLAGWPASTYEVELDPPAADVAAYRAWLDA